MSRSRSLTQAKADFISHYAPMFPHLEIESYLSSKNTPVLLYSPFHKEELRRLFAKAKLSWTPLTWFPYALERPSEVSVSASLPGFAEGWLYSLNPASLLPVVALHPKSTDRILDASAAPGGKSIAILNYTYPHLPVLVANDRSSERTKRLQNALKLFGYSRIQVTNHPIQALEAAGIHGFDKVLLDAPCTGEKHMFNSKHFLKLWSPDQSAKLVATQHELLGAVLPLIKPGGRLVYSTCALSRAENEDQVETFLQEHPGVKLAKPMERINDPASTFDPMFVGTFKR